MSLYPARDTHGTAPRLPGDPERLEMASWLRLASVALVGTAAAVALAIDWTSPVRAGLTLVFLLFGPGLAIAEFLHVRDGVQQLAIAGGVSLAVDTIVSVTSLYVGVFSAGLVFAFVAGITVGAVVLTVLRSLRTPIPDPQSGRAAT